LQALAARFEELRYSRASQATTRRQTAQLRRAVARYRPEFVGPPLVAQELAA
jgi:hypothetical protein